MDAFAQLRKALEESQPGPTLDETAYSITKTESEHRYTLGVMYVPGARDSDNEFIEADDLQKATWDFFRSGQREIKDTHTDRTIGELVELMSWPYEVEVDAQLGSGEVHKYKLPAGTVFAGVVWQPEAWALVKAGKLRGYSMGGKAVRMKEAAQDTDLPAMKDLGVHAVGKDRKIPNKPGVTNWIEEHGGLPSYIRQIAEDLADKHPIGKAIQLAIGIVRNWCSGKGNVTAKTRAKACKAVAQYEKMRAATHAKSAGDPESFFGPTADDVLKAEGDVSVTLLAELFDDAREFEDYA